jgi:hypothetical protein
MIVMVQRDGRCALEAADDTNSFSVQAADGDLDELLRSHSWGRFDGTAAWISVEALRKAAAGHVPDDWPARFDAMLTFAESKGWLSDDGSAVRGHVEPRPATQPSDQTQ